MPVTNKDCSSVRTHPWAWLTKIRILLHLLGIVATPVVSVCVTSKAHLVNWCPSTVYLQTVKNRPLHPWQTGIAVHRYVGTEPPQFPTRRRCCRISVHRWKDVMDRHLCLSPTHRSHFERSGPIQVELSRRLKAVGKCGIDNRPILLVTLHLAPMIVG